MHAALRTAPIPASRWCRVALLMGLAAILTMIAAAPARAADGVRIIPATVGWPEGSQIDADISGEIVVFQNHTAFTADPPMWVDMKYLGDGSAPIHLDDSDGATTMQFNPRVCVDDAQGDTTLDALDTIYVVWTRMRDVGGGVTDSDIMIWKGSYDSAAATWTPVATYPKTLVSGPAAAGAPVEPTQQTHADIGVTNVGGAPGIVVAWEDTRDNGPWAPQIYLLSLSAEPVDDVSWDPTSAGILVDNTDVLARGQRSPEVGPGGIFWLDDRWSFWTPGDIKDTAVWRADLSSGGPVSDVHHWNNNHDYDDGEWGSRSLVATANGAAWLRKGPYGDGVTMPYVKPIGGSGAVLTSLPRTYNLDAYCGFPTTRTVYALGGPHAGPGTDGDVFFYDSSTGTRVPVCDRTGAMPPYTYDAGYPAVGPGSGIARVVWSDSRHTTNPSDEETDSRLYQAFVPGVTIAIRDASILWSSRFRFMTTVAPNFTGEPVYLQRLTRIKQDGGLAYRPVSKTGIKATLDAKSSAIWNWKPPAKGTYYFRISFNGASKYNTDGVSTNDKYPFVPHIANASKVIRVVAK